MDFINKVMDVHQVHNIVQYMMIMVNAINVNMVRLFQTMMEIVI